MATSRNEPLVSKLPDGFRWTCELYSKTRCVFEGGSKRQDAT